MHIHITAPNPDGGKARVLIDGKDISRELAVEPFAVEFGELATVTMRFVPDELTVDLPAAVVAPDPEEAYIPLDAGSPVCAGDLVGWQELGRKMGGAQ